MARHLTLQEREMVSQMHHGGSTQVEIARRLGRHPCLGRVRRSSENRGQLPACVSIEGRPAVVDRRARCGDWEGDTVVGAGHRGGAVTLVDRKSGYLLLGKVRDRQATTVRQAITQLFHPLPAKPAKDVDPGQRQGVRRTRATGGGGRFACVLCEALLCVAARHQRKHQRPGAAVLPQREATWPTCRCNSLRKSNIF